MAGEFLTLNSKVDDAPFSAYHVEPKGRRKGGHILETILSFFCE